MSRSKLFSSKSQPMLLIVGQLSASVPVHTKNQHNYFGRPKFIRDRSQTNSATDSVINTHYDTKGGGGGGGL